MSKKQSSRLTLADLLDRISGADMPPKLKADTSSAVRKVAAVLGADPGLIPVDPANLRRRLEGISHEVAGVSPGRLKRLGMVLFGRRTPARADMFRCPNLMNWFWKT